MKNFKTEWTGSCPNLCMGVWKLYIDGKDKSDLIPEDLRDYPMGTVGVYWTWDFDDDWGEIWESYIDGLECDDWIKENYSWIETPYISEESFKNLENIMMKSNQIKEYVNYNDLIINYYE